jgi:hypothetical protein
MLPYVLLFYFISMHLFLCMFCYLLEAFVVALWAGGHSRVNNDTYLPTYLPYEESAVTHNEM